MSWQCLSHSLANSSHCSCRFWPNASVQVGHVVHVFHKDTILPYKVKPKVIIPERRSLQASLELPRQPLHINELLDEPFRLCLSCSIYALGRLDEEKQSCPQRNNFPSTPAPNKEDPLLDNNSIGTLRLTWQGSNMYHADD